MKIEKEFKFEYFVTVLFITVGVLGVKYVGFEDIYTSIFSILAIIQIPLSFIAARICRIKIYELIRGYGNYEN